MIKVYSWATPNGHQVHIMLAESGRVYRAIPVDIGAGDPFASKFLAINANNRSPALLDPAGHDSAPISLFESGARLSLLASKTGLVLPRSTRARNDVLQWPMIQMGGPCPMPGQAHQVRTDAPAKLLHAMAQYASKARRLDDGPPWRQGSDGPAQAAGRCTGV
jgi:GST-like protein